MMPQVKWEGMEIRGKPTLQKHPYQTLDNSSDEAAY